MYIITDVYENGVLKSHQEFKYEDFEELEKHRKFFESVKPKMALLSLNGKN